MVRDQLLRYLENNIESEGKKLKTIRVVAAVIRAVNEKGEPVIFATQRGYGEWKDGWEFPGGKIEEGRARNRH